MRGMTDEPVAREDLERIRRRPMGSDGWQHAQRPLRRRRGAGHAVAADGEPRMLQRPARRSSCASTGTSRGRRCEPTDPTPGYDIGTTLQTMLLAAHALGLGGGPVSLARGRRLPRCCSARRPRAADDRVPRTPPRPPADADARATKVTWRPGRTGSASRRRRELPVGSRLELRLGIDVGGTNTDAVVLDREDRLLARAKVPTTLDVSSGIAAAARRRSPISAPIAHHARDARHDACHERRPRTSPPPPGRRDPIGPPRRSRSGRCSGGPRT